MVEGQSQNSREIAGDAITIVDHPNRLLELYEEIKPAPGEVFKGIFKMSEATETLNI